MMAWLEKVFAKLGKQLAAPYHFVEGIIDYLSDHDWNLYSAGLAFYALIALTPLVILAVVVGGAVFGTALAQAELHATIMAEAGPQVADLVVSFATGASDLGSMSIASVIAFVLLVWSSTSLLTRLRSAVHEMFGIEPPALTSGAFRRGIVKFLRYRLFAVLGTAAFGIMFIALLGTRLALSLLEEGSSELLEVPLWVWEVLDIVVAVVFITVLVRLVFWLLPDRRPVGRAPWIGGLVTAILLVLGRTGVAVYLSIGSVASAYGAAGTLVVFLGWAFWSAWVFLLGARLTWVLAERAAHAARATFPPPSETVETIEAEPAHTER